MNSEKKLEHLPSSLHFVGAGGIGMSALAQMAACLGCAVSGSDRALGAPENEVIFRALRAQGVKLYPQDGSRFAQETAPDAMVYSTAIEEDNPDFLAAPESCARIHRSEALRLLVRALSGEVFAVTGSCGKTSVSAWLAESFDRLGQSPSLLCGGLARHFSKDGFAGNYSKGSSPLCVLEADESDRSLLNYSADWAVILNIGTDHYSKEELAEVFRKFLAQTRKGAVLGEDVLNVMTDADLAHRKILIFSDRPDVPEFLRGHRVVRIRNYEASPDGVFAEIDHARVRLPGPGKHQALNAGAVYAALLLAGMTPERILPVLGSFSGVWRRFEFAGQTPSGTKIYDDYAHNVEKLCSCISAAKEICGGRLALFFQPHGFRPLGFMREELFPELEKILGPGDVFAFLPVFYAGGTTSFKPESNEVAAEYAQRHPGERYRSFADRASASDFIGSLGPDDLVVIAGARDNSLSDWAFQLGRKG